MEARRPAVVLRGDGGLDQAGGGGGGGKWTDQNVLQDKADGTS